FGLEPGAPEENGKDMDAQQPFQGEPALEERARDQPTALIELLPEPGIQADDPMSEAGRKTFRFHYRRMLYHEPGTRQGEDIEALHDMRVATRRMRAAFRVFGGYFEPKAVARYSKGLKRTGRALGPVRDLDVFRAKVQAYVSTLPESKQESLNGFLSTLEVQRDAARARMIAYLNDAKYARFVERFGQFVETEGMGSWPVTLQDGEPWPHRVRHVAPMAIYERLAAVRAYDEWVTIPDPPLTRLHALRIACKRLRYALEFFGEVLGSDTKALVKEIVTVQDHLGALQDTVVASAILREYLQRGTWGTEAVDESQLAPEDAAGVQDYLVAKQSELEQLLDTFPEAWQRITETEFSQMVADAVAVL
ncbi:MAG TPA: CHAD domain-containing protein, partial [Anaerolineae bacterium]|nr:CHAD domain-containing protein [Anaerolineae bacterium]